jgi:iron(III) transport system substrate-binding protein
MIKNAVIITLGLLVIALPFLLRQAPQIHDWQPGDSELIVVTPNNEAIRFEFGQAFSQWHQRQYGQPVKVDWRALGGATEIMRYLEGAFLASYRAYWQSTGNDWPASASQQIMASRYAPDGSKVDKLYSTLRSTDDPNLISAGIDLLFGGGEYDHNVAFKRGMTVAPWSEGQVPADLFEQDGVSMIPEHLSGETWRTPTLFGAALSTFGICYNTDRLRELGVDVPTRWDDLANPKLIGQVGVADPTKSGSIAKSYEMIIQQKIQQTVLAAGFTDDDINRFETAFTHSNKPWELPANVPSAYQQAVEGGWRQGLQLIGRIGGNARYFTDSASKVPIDVSKGDAAIGLAIDFYARYQAEHSRAPDGTERMVFITPEGGSSVSSDPISLLRGAPHRLLASRFIAFSLSEDGQKLWNYRPGVTGGPQKYALRRLPIRRSFYPSLNAAVNNRFEAHRPHLTDKLADPAINPYEVGKKFTYRPRWTSQHFNIHRSLIKAMCLDAGEELKAAWQAIQQHGGAEKNPEAMQAFSALPDDFNWRSAIDDYSRANALDTMQRWVKHFRQTFQKAKTLAEGGES